MMGLHQKHQFRSRSVVHVLAGHPWIDSLYVLEARDDVGTVNARAFHLACHARNDQANGIGINQGLAYRINITVELSGSLLGHHCAIHCIQHMVAIAANQLKIEDTIESRIREKNTFHHFLGGGQVQFKIGTNQRATTFYLWITLFQVLLYIPV